MSTYMSQNTKARQSMTPWAASLTAVLSWKSLLMGRREERGQPATRPLTRPEVVAGDDNGDTIFRKVPPDLSYLDSGRKLLVVAAESNSKKFTENWNNVCIVRGDLGWVHSHTN